MRIAAELDIECYRDYFLVKLRTPDGAYHNFGMWEGHPLDIAGLVNLLATVRIYTFNGVNYDLPMLTLALYGADCWTLKQASDNIIARGMKWWQFYNSYGIQTPDYIDHVDLMEVAPGVRIGLKMYMGRLHAPKMQDLPIEPSASISPSDRFDLSEYCGNDLIGTWLLRDCLAERLALREAISEQYKIDVRSKSDAQIAEAVVKSQLGFVPEKRYVPHGYMFHYTPPEFIQYATPQMQELLNVVRNAPFVVTDKEEAIELGYEETVRTGVNIPPELKGRDIRIGHGVYRMGIGGLHSQESDCAYRSIAGVQQIVDVDVKSYYPSLILLMQMYPQQLGPAFRIIYNAIYQRRLLSKSEAARIADLYDASGNAELKTEADLLRTEADGLKIVLNGTFGKLFSKYSIFYAPEFGIATTMTGQLALLMLIEMMEMSGIRVLSANTDGITLMIPHGMHGLAMQIVAWWEKRTGLEMEHVNYSALYQRDVNNYIAITDKGKVKRKGVFNQGGVLSGPQGKGPDKDICADAVVAYLKDGIPVEWTIQSCKDIRKFVVIRTVKGGGKFVPQGGGHGLADDEHYLGKAVRWYHSINGGHIAYVSNGNQVAGSKGCSPCMDLPAELPNDIDYQHYIDVAKAMMEKWK